MSASISAQGYGVPVCLFRKPSNWHSLGRLVDHSKGKRLSLESKVCACLCVFPFCLCLRENQNVTNVCICKNAEFAFVYENESMCLKVKSQNMLLLCESTFWNWVNISTLTGRWSMNDNSIRSTQKNVMTVSDGVFHILFRLLQLSFLLLTVAAWTHSCWLCNSDMMYSMSILWGHFLLLLSAHT